MEKTVDCKELALKKVNISGDILGKFGTFEIEQTFINNTKQVLNVGYTFPIVESATVVGFEVIIGDKVLKGMCKEKTKAKKEFRKNIVKGNSAYLLEEKSDNIFAISIGKLDKNEEVKIKIKFIDKFEIVDNQIQILIPTLVPPKYNCKITDKLSYGKVGYSVDFNINIEKNVNYSNIISETHKLDITHNENGTKIEVLNYDMSKDFKLYIDLKEELSSKAIAAKTKEGSDILYLSFMPEITDTYEDSEKEYVFLIDVSGSMYGKKLDETKNAVIHCLRQLDEGDSFNIIAFESDFEAMSKEPLKYNEHNLNKAFKYVDSLDDKGGTEILEPIQFVLDNDKSEKIILLFTDGEVGNEEEIIRYVEENISKSRIFPFGIDTSVNTYFINELAKIGQGKAEFIAPDEKIDDKIIRTFARIQTPLLEDLRTDYKENKLLDEIKENHTLFNFEFYNIFAKVEKLVDDIELKGQILDREYCWKIRKDDVIETKIDLETIFAKEEIDRLEKYISNSRDDDEIEDYKKMIIELSEKYNINSKYTSFLTVYERENKVLDIPKYQETKLSSHGLSLFSKLGEITGAMTDSFSPDDCCYDEEYCLEPSFNGHFSFSSLDIPEFLNPRCRLGGESSTRKDDFTEELEEKIENLVSSSGSILTNMLYYLYLASSDSEKFDTDNVLEFIKSNLDKIQSDKICMQILCAFYQLTQNSEIYDMLTDEYKDLAKKQERVSVDIKYLGKLEIKELMKENKIEANIDSVLWYMCDKNLE